MLKKNDVLKVKITDINHMGLGVAKHEGAVIFVQGGVTEDEAEIKIIKAAKNYYVARIESLLSPSRFRAESKCIHSKRCGGCIYQGITSEYEKVLKENRVKAELSRFGVRCNRFEELISARTEGYRNKLQCPLDENGNMGFYAQKSHEIIPVENCMLEEPLLAPVYAYLRDFFTAAPCKGLRHIYLRCGAGTGQIMVCFVCRSEVLPNKERLISELTERFPEIKSIILNVNPDDTNVVLGKKCITLFGSDFIEDTLMGLSFKISPLSFYQVNRDCTELLYRTAAGLAEIKPTESVVDLYCGIGTVGLCINSLTPARSLVGVEIVPDAVKNAKENAEANGVTNAEFYCSEAESFDFGNPDVLIVDPPRKGLDPKLIETVGRVSPKRIVYISCSPDTLARDCSMLEKHGYRLECARPVNMFPRTAHIETVALLCK